MNFSILTSPKFVRQAVPKIGYEDFFNKIGLFLSSGSVDPLKKEILARQIILTKLENKAISDKDILSEFGKRKYYTPKQIEEHMAPVLSACQQFRPVNGQLKTLIGLINGPALLGMIPNLGVASFVTWCASWASYPTFLVTCNNLRKQLKRLLEISKVGELDHVYISTETGAWKLEYDTEYPKLPDRSYLVKTRKELIDIYKTEIRLLEQFTRVYADINAQLAGSGVIKFFGTISRWLEWFSSKNRAIKIMSLSILRTALQMTVDYHHHVTTHIFNKLAHDEGNEEVDTSISFISTYEEIIQLIDQEINKIH